MRGSIPHHGRHRILRLLAGGELLPWNRELGLGAQATVLTRDPAGVAAKCPHLASDAAITLLAGDVRSFEFPQGEFRYVVHAATEAVAQQSADEMRSTIVDGTRRTLEFAERCGARKFLLTSSGAVYGRQSTEMTHVPETYVPPARSLDTTNAYAEGKRAAETMCAEATGFEAKIARCWAFCGPHLALDAHFAIGNFIGDVLAGQPIAIGGDGTPRRSYLYAADLAAWLWTMAVPRAGAGADQRRPAHDVSILELAEIVARTLAPGAEIRVAKQAVPGAAPALCRR